MSPNEKAILDEIYKTAFAAAVKASKLVLQYWPNPLNPHFDKTKVMEIFEKSNGIGNYATIADMESEKLIIKMIQKNPVLQHHRILAEETGGNTKESDYIWMIDPIDGTQNFKNGIGDFGVSIGVVYKNEPVVGIIAMPAFNHVITAIKGEGAKLLSLNGEELLDLKKITFNEPIEKALIANDLGYTDRVETWKKGAEKIMDKVAYVPVYASSSAGNYRLAMGFVGAYFHQVPTKYDVAASAAIISEAGGVVTNLKGDPIDWLAPTVTYLGARSKGIHERLLELLNS